MTTKDGPASTRAAKRPFWMHQAVEYILGAVLVAQGLQVPDASEAVVPAACGVAILCNAASVRGGALSAFRLVSRSVHRVLDVVVIVATVALALQPWFAVDPSARIVMVAIAGVMAFVWWQSSFAEKPDRSARTGSGGAAAGSAGDGSSVDRSTQVGRMAGRLVGGGINAGRRAAAKRSARDATAESAESRDPGRR